VQLAAEAIARMEGLAFILALSPDDVRSRGASLPAAVCQRLGRSDLSVSVATEPARISAGVVVRDASGRQHWDNSLEARLERMWPLLRSKIADHLGLPLIAELSGAKS